MLQKRSVELPVELIGINPDQPRKFFNEEELEELKKSIFQYGVLQPLIVKKEKNGTYYLIAGERRLRAAKLAGLETVPVIVKDFDDKNSALISVIENVQRENLTYIEEAYAYKKLIDDFGYTQLELAEKIGKKQSTISNKLRILNLPFDIQEMLCSAKLTERHARALLKISDEFSRKKILQRVINNNLNVKQTEKLIDDFIRKSDERQRNMRKISYISYKIYVNTIRNAFSQVKEKEKNAKIFETDKGEYMEVQILIPKNNGCFT